MPAALSPYFRAVVEGIDDAKAGNLVELSAVRAKWLARIKNRGNQQTEAGPAHPSLTP